MKPQPAIEFFGSRGELAAALDVTETTIGYWVKRDWMPYDRQCQIQVESEKPEYAKGRPPLLASWDDVPEEFRRAA